jgi:hypothetical protein
MHPTPVGSGKGGLFRRLALPFSLFVLGASLSLVAWLQGMNRDRSLREFEDTARENARFVERLRLPRSPELARNLAEVLGVTESRVSQLHTRMKRRIKEKLDEVLHLGM